MTFWHDLTPRSRIGLAVAACLIVAATAAAGWWLLRADYQTLFADLQPQDAGAMTAELDRLKLPYRLADEGTAILVDKESVHSTRLKLMGRELPLHGAVGLELFNNTDFGMTEFAQKVNYQRALQGELTRTIQSLPEVKDVRVLLALPEQGLFRQATAKAKASVRLALRPGLALRAEQVTGVQRLVAAAVQGMSPQEVTIVDGNGVSLTRADGSGAGAADAGAGRLELKRETETHLARKVSAVLDQAFGAGQAIGSVDVTLDMDQIRTTTEDVLPASARAGTLATGVVVREKESLRDGAAALDVRVSDPSTARGGSTQRDVEYAVGRRVEQVVSQPGSIRRIQVVAVVRAALSNVREDQLRRLLAAAVGASTERGDVVVIQSLAAVTSGESAGPAALTGSAGSTWSDDASGALPVTAGETAVAGDPGARDAQRVPLLPGVEHPLLLAGALAVLAFGILLFASTRVARRAAPVPAPTAALSDAERARALQRVRDWVGARSPAGAAPARDGRWPP